MIIMTNSQAGCCKKNTVVDSLHLLSSKGQNVEKKSERLFPEYLHTSSIKMSERPIPEKIKCRLSGEVCKRGVRVGCCNTIASRYISGFIYSLENFNCQWFYRSAATKYVTTNRTCWNESCKTEVSTGDLINDENLRAQVERFNKGEEVDETVLSDIIVKAGKENTEEPPVKKIKQNNVSQSQNKTNKQSKPRKRVTLGMMKERNAEFDKYLLPEEKSCQVINSVYKEL